MAAPNFELITELQTCTRRDFPLTDVTLLNPNAANPIIDGEWLELATTYTLGRGTGNPGVANPMVFPVHTERGRYDTQAIGKVNVIMLGMYEAETIVHDALGGGAAVGSQLVITDCTVGGIAGRRGLALDSTTDNRVVVGFVSKLTGSGQTARLRFVHFANQWVYTV